jgi:hypothetical protein
MIIISADVHGTGHNDAKVIVIYLVPRSVIWANYPLGPFLISWFLPPVGRHLVRILSPDFSSGCLLIHNNWLFVLKVSTVFVSITCFGKLFHISTILCEKLYFLIYVLLFFLYFFWLWPLVRLIAVRLVGKMCSCCTLSVPGPFVLIHVRPITFLP